MQNSTRAPRLGAARVVAVRPIYSVSNSSLPRLMTVRSISGRSTGGNVATLTVIGQLWQTPPGVIVNVLGLGEQDLADVVIRLARVL